MWKRVDSELSQPFGKRNLSQRRTSCERLRPNFRDALPVDFSGNDNFGRRCVDESGNDALTDSIRARLKSFG